MILWIAEGPLLCFTGIVRSFIPEFCPIPLNQSGPPSKTQLSFNNQPVLTLVYFILRGICSSSAYIWGTHPLGNKELCKMICHMKHIFMWIFLIPQPTGNDAFIWDFVLIFSVFTFFFHFRTRSIQLIMYFIKMIFMLTPAD